MAVLAYNEILPKKVILWNDEPFEVISAHVFRKQQRKPVNQTKIRSLRNGKVVEQTYHQNENAIEAFEKAALYDSNNTAAISRRDELLSKILEDENP